MQTMKEIFQEIEASGGMTPSRRLRDIAKRFPDQIAFRDKRYGILQVEWELKQLESLSS